MRKFPHNLSITQARTPYGFRRDFEAFPVFPLNEKESKETGDKFKILLPKRLILGLRMLYGENISPKNMFLGALELDEHTLTPFFQTEITTLMAEYRNNMYADFVYSLEYAQNETPPILYDYSRNPYNWHHGIALEYGGRVPRSLKNPNIKPLRDLRHFYLHDVHGNDMDPHKMIGITKPFQPWLNPEFKKELLKIYLMEPKEIFKEDVFESRHHLNKAFLKPEEIILVA